MFVFNLNGPINGFLESIHLIDGPINFINDTDWTLKVIMVMNIWSTVPYFMTIYLASLVDLPDAMYEAAEIDGANAFQKLRYSRYLFASDYNLCFAHRYYWDIPNV